jgi:hypothetical protein
MRAITRAGTRRARAAGALVAALAAMLAGCSPASPDPDPPTTTHAPARTTTPAATPAPTATIPAPAPSPALPADWTDDGEAGAEAAARYFLDLYAYTVSTQDTAAWVAVSDPECVFCQSVLDGVADDVAASRVARPGPVLVSSVAVSRLDETGFEVEVHLTTGPDMSLYSDGRFEHRADQHTGTITLIADQRDGTWVLEAGGA